MMADKKTTIIHPNKSRRMILTGAALLTLSGMAPVLAGSRCLSTPSQPEGPFYPLRWPEQNQQDLTFSGKARGESFFLQGKVMDADCTPIAHALVELWQANTYGRYRHARDNHNKAMIDPDFYGLGRVKTNTDGEFEFKTIIPGSYEAGPEWQRPPHLHFKVWLNNEKRVITQMYFADNPLNNDDLILGQLSSAEQQRVVVSLGKSRAEKKGTFNIYTAS